MDRSNGYGIGGSVSSGGYGGKRVSLYVGQLTWVCDKNTWKRMYKTIFFSFSGQQMLI
jgi:hypothetical protein